jgi:hypothetical protein
MVEAIRVFALFLYAEGPLEANPDEELEVVGKTGNKG